MTIVKYTPFENRINRFFNSSFFAPEVRCESEVNGKWNPVVDIYEDDSNIVIKADLPGLKKEDLSIDIKDRVLTFKGERVSDEEVKKEDFFRRERAFGKFERAFSVPGSVEIDNIIAEFKDGVLKIDIPKPEERKPKQVTIN